MNEVLLQPLLMGLSTGLFCCATCLPFVVPVLVAEQRSGRQTFGVLGRIILGRLIGYVLFGALFGWLGERLPGAVFHAVSILSLLVLSVVLILYAAGLLKPGASLCAGGGRGRERTPLLMGFLMGINVCPPFLMSLFYVFTLHSMGKGIVYFLVFFAATSVYFLPLGMLGWLGRMGEFRRVARVSAVLVGVLFAVYGIYSFGRGGAFLHVP